jgi:acyl-CoA synthetase (AMP-forming)/AMP-acid ligase II
MNVADLVLYQCRQRPAAPALCAPGSEFNVVSYARLERFIHNVSRRGRALGLAPGDVVAILVRDPILHLAFILGLARIGVVTVSVRSPDLPKELRVAAMISDGAIGFGGATRIVVADAEWVMGEDVALDEREVHRGDSDDLHRIALTSGTTGDARAVGFSRRMVVERILHFFWMHGAAMAGCSRVFVDPGLATNFGYSAVMYVLARGGMVMFRGAEPIETMQAFGLYKVQGVIAAPAAVAEFADYYNRATPFVSGLEAIYMGGSLLSQALSDRIRSELCSNLNYGYGSTEASVVSVAPAKVVTAMPGAVGFVAPAFTVEAVDENGRALPAGEVGRIRIRGPLCTGGYLGDADASASAFRDGWFYPGDLGAVTTERMLVISGREAAVLNLGGEKTNPERIEHVLMSFPAVAQAGVVGVTDSLGIERLCAAVVWRSGADEAGLRSHCQRLLPPEFVPSRFVTVAAIARNETGKIDRGQLASAVSAT